MSEKPYPALCLDCKHARPEKDYDWNHRCFNQKVVASDAWALSNNKEGEPTGASCYEERKKISIFAPCGAKGKLWESKYDLSSS